MKIRGLCLIIMLFIFTGTNGWAKTLYVRPSTSCSVNGDGTAYKCAAAAGGAGAWNSLANVQWGAGAGKVSAGDTLYICGTFRHQMYLTPTISGTARSPIVIRGDYPGAPGVIDQSMLITTPWTYNTDIGVYTTALPETGFPVDLFYENGILMQQATATACTDGNWFTDNTTIYYNPTDGLAPHYPIEVVTEKYPFGIFGRYDNSYLTVQYLTLQRMTWGMIFGSSSLSSPSGYGNISVLHNTLVDAGWVINFELARNQTATNLACRYNVITHGGSGIRFFVLEEGTFPAKVEGFSTCTVTNNTLNQIGMASNTVTWTQATGVSGDRECISSQNMWNSLWEKNIITNSAARGIILYAKCIGNAVVAGNIVRYNQVTNCTDDAFLAMVQGGGVGIGGNYIYYNLFHGALENTNTYGAVLIVSYAGNNSSAVTNYFYNNTVVAPNYIGITLGGGGNIGSWVIKNNIISGAQYNVWYVAMPGLTIDYNLYNNSSSFEANGTTWATWEGTYKYDTHGYNANPLFVSSSNFQLQSGSPAVKKGVNLGAVEAKPITNCGLSSVTLPPNIGGF